MINQGALEASECRTLGAVSPPEFAFECAVRPGDRRTVVEVAAFDEGRTLGRKVVGLLLWPTVEAPRTWSRPKGSSDVPAGLFASRFVAEVNAALEGTGSLAALFATYVPLGAFDRKDAEIAVITRLNTLRRDRGLPLAQWTLWPEDEGAVIARNLASRRWAPSDASQHALNATAEVAKGRVTGYLQLVDDLDHFQFPPEVLLRPDINVFLSVATYKGEAWAQTRYVVCFVLARKGDIETARLGSGAPPAL